VTAETTIRGATLSGGERSIGTKHADWGWREVFTVDQVENIVGARVAGALRAAADHLDRHGAVSPSERLREMADDVDAS
jgi:hypothetical protein